MKRLKWIVPFLLPLFLWVNYLSAQELVAEEATLTVTATATAVSATPTLTATPLPSSTPTATPLPSMTPDWGDIYEPDSAEHPAIYTGPMRRTFAPTGDIDYVIYRLKGETLIRTSNLTGAADTSIEVWDIQSNVLLIANDDHNGLASEVIVRGDGERDALMIIHNQSLGYGAEVGYTLEIIPQANYTPTPIAPPTGTPVPAPTDTPHPTIAVTYTPYPTYTPFPSATPPPTAVPPPSGPRATATPSVQLILRVEIFLDADADESRDPTEGVGQVWVEVNALDGSYTSSGYTDDQGVFLLQVDCPSGKAPIEQMEVAVPYLQQAQQIELEANDNLRVVAFPLSAPVLPIALP